MTVANISYFQHSLEHDRTRTLQRMQRPRFPRNIDEQKGALR